MKRLIGLAMSLALVLGMAACGGGDVCEDAFNKQKDCVSSLDCASITDPAAKMTCESMKQIFGSMSYSDAKKACEQAGQGSCECEGQAKEAAEAIMDCDLDPQTCSCPTQ